MVRESLGNIPGLAEMFVGTIHAFALELLKSEVPKYLRFELLNEVQQGLFVDRHSTQSALTTCTDLQGTPLRRYRDTQRYLSALDILREADLDEKALDGCSLLDGLEAYSGLLEERSYLDYSAILEAAVDVLTNDRALRGRLAERVRCVIVDEYQDVNPIQEAIVWSLHELGAKICVVGDDDQTICQWRGSDVENILTVETRYPGVEQIPLEENFRSSDGIVETARAFIAQNRQRLPKAMKPTGAQANEAGDIVALSFNTPEEEAQYIAETAKTLRGIAIRDDDKERGISWSDMAVLLRSVKANAEPITAALTAAGIPYVVVGMTNLFGTAEAEAARQLFYFMASRTGVDEGSIERAWQDADLGLDPAELRRAIGNAARARASLTERDQKRWGLYSIQRLFLAFLEDASVREERVPNGRGDIVFYNLGKFSQLISDYETIHYQSKPAEKYSSFADFLQHRAADAYPEGWQDNQYANPDAVRIMTVHQAKGMQWPVVFLPALLRNRFPAAGVGGASVWHLLPRAGVQRQARYEGTVEDERRLFYER
jgi:DNA helicase-2/ATP-dependent DNA helicase PcrA